MVGFIHTPACTQFFSNFNGILPRRPLEEPQGTPYEPWWVHRLSFPALVTFPTYKKTQEITKLITSALQTDARISLDAATMSTAIIIIFLALTMGTSGGAIRPVVTLIPNWGNVLHGDEVTLRCDMPSTVPEESRASRTYHWYKDKSPIFRDQHQQTLRRAPSTLLDSGQYQCRVGASDISDAVTLNVTISSVILQRPPSAIYEGDPLTLKCHHLKEYSSVPPRFFKNNQEIKSQFPDSEFRIQKVDLNTSGLYKCSKQIEFPGRSGYREFSDEFLLSVKELFSPPEIKVTPSRIIAGDNMTVRCDTRRDPLRGGTELHFAFYRDGRTVRGYNVSDTYRVPSSQLEDFGIYTCDVRTASGAVRKMSDGFHNQMYDYTVQNIIRLVISGFVLAASLCLIYFHNKW
ncbi:high affinity immunoglobulin gamma Fc receptor I-like [Lithobates pipiens]